MKQKIDWKVMVTGIVALTALEIYALSLGFNGTLLKAVMVAIGLTIGVSIPNPLKK